MVPGRQQGSMPGNTAAMQQQQQELMAAMQQQQQQQYALEQYQQQMPPQDEEEAYRQQQALQQQRKMGGHPQTVDNLGSHVSTMSVMDCHGNNAVPMAYHTYAQQQPIYRSSSYQVQSIHRL
jgi:hypothetical protein